MALIFEKDNDLNLEATELRLGLPGCSTTNKETSQACTPRNKRSLPTDDENHSSENHNQSTTSSDSKQQETLTSPPAKAQVVGWPPVRSYRKNCMQGKNSAVESGSFVKVSMDGAPYLRKMDLKVYSGYPQLLTALEEMFKFNAGDYTEREGYNSASEFVPTYQDKDGDWMLLGDVPWGMFISSCKRIRVMKGSDARGLGCAV